MSDKKLYIVDSETGEITGEFQEGDKVIKSGTIDFLKNTIEINNKFIKLFTINIMPVIEQLKDKRNKINYNALSLMFYLMQFISYTNGLLQHKNGEPLTNKYILENFSMCKTDLYYCIKLLKDKGIISIVLVQDKNYYIFNPWIASAGKRIDKTHLKIFENTIYIKNQESEE